MATIVRGKNLEVTPALKDYVLKHEKKVTKYFENEVNVQALLSVEKIQRLPKLR
jgi:putative sigma-54 modulation protein